MKFKLGVAFSAVAVSLFLANAALAPVYQWARGSPFPEREWRAALGRILQETGDGPLEAPLNPRQPSDTLESPKALHPYLGFVFAPSPGLALTPYGFLAPNPRTPPGDGPPFRIGVLGGSAAMGMTQFAEEVLVRELKKHPAYQGKNLRVVNLAVSGYKQPQQAMVLTYLFSLGEKLDMVINLDGFNEVALAPVENVPMGVSPFYPRQWFLRAAYLLPPETWTLLAYREGSRRLRRRLAGAVRRCYLDRCRLGLWAWAQLNTRWEAYEKRLSPQGSSARSAQKKTLPYQVSGPPYEPASPDQIYDDLAAVWRQGSLQINALCRGQGIPYFHFLQPNQYLPGSKPMRPPERQAAVIRGHIYEAGVLQGYPRLRAQGKILQAQGVFFSDLTQVFADHPEPLYADSCCHYNREGSEVIVRAMAREILRRTPASGWGEGVRSAPSARRPERNHR